ISGGTIQAEENLSVSVGTGDMLEELAGDVARIEVGKNQNCGLAGDFAFRQFADRDFRNQSGINLEFAVEVGFDFMLLRFLSGEGGGGLNPADGRMRRAAFGGK